MQISCEEWMLKSRPQDTLQGEDNITRLVTTDYTWQPTVPNGWRLETQRPDRLEGDLVESDPAQSQLRGTITQYAQSGPWPFRVIDAPFRLACVLRQFVEVSPGVGSNLSAALKRLPGWDNALAALGRRSQPGRATALALELPNIGLPGTLGTASELLREHFTSRGESVPKRLDLAPGPTIGVLLTWFCFLPAAEDGNGYVYCNRGDDAGFTNQDLNEKIARARKPPTRKKKSPSELHRTVPDWWQQFVALERDQRAGRPSTARDADKAAITNLARMDFAHACKREMDRDKKEWEAAARFAEEGLCKPPAEPRYVWYSPAHKNVVKKRLRARMKMSPD